jgi:hypothetical protein
MLKHCLQTFAERAPCEHDNVFLDCRHRPLPTIRQDDILDWTWRSCHCVFVDGFADVVCGRFSWRDDCLVPSQGTDHRLPKSLRGRERWICCRLDGVVWDISR